MEHITTAERTESGAGLPVHEQVYRRLREMVLFGDLQPGQPVTIQGLTERLEAGMTPVREALRRLTAEGALEFRGNRRITVPVLDAAAVEELSVARRALEPELARRAALRAGPEDIVRLRATDARLDRAMAAADIAGYLRENHRFHAELNALADAPILRAMVDGLWLRFGPSLRVVCDGPGPLSLPDRHKDMLAGLEARDADAVASAMDRDVRQGMERIAAHLPGN
ncbi:GntR family transcriptional regulator [Roseivivax sediminis]|uniref:DNA-binding transcriptional regulator, GntR family n=1 Tax=Roseivivax sediminis TaxID=936889 RepID=A0A1I2A9U9_9RHOB|nr:GntR family transcriptional regulator [Roseivivax sediminis]SFE40358.1 DNA-binding transcriptional regulator, GntR family [Roseivivax sediminis]